MTNLSRYIDIKTSNEDFKCVNDYMKEQKLNNIRELIMDDCRKSPTNLTMGVGFIQQYYYSYIDLVKQQKGEDNHEYRNSHTD